jgi:hypothetical protein
MIRTTLERLARDTLGRLDDGERLSCRQGEETITDINLLDLVRLSQPSLLLEKKNKREESTSGVDWELWIGGPTRPFLRLAVQAKRLNARGNYKLRHANRHGEQRDLLEQYAAANRALPLYCLYNWAHIPFDSQLHWHCCGVFDAEQLGCTFARTDTIQNARASTFADLHTFDSTIPWRCLTCRKGIGALTEGRSPKEFGPGYPSWIQRGEEGSRVPDDKFVWPQLPPFLSSALASGSGKRFDEKELPPNFYKPEVGAPKRIAVLQSDREE